MDLNRILNNSLPSFSPLTNDQSRVAQQPQAAAPSGQPEQTEKNLLYRQERRGSHPDIAGHYQIQKSSELEQKRESKNDMALAGYLMACASIGQTIDDKNTLQRLRIGQAVLDRMASILPVGRGNVAGDIQTSNGTSYVAVQQQRDAVEFLKAALNMDTPTPDANLPPLRQRLASLKSCWPEDFSEQLHEHFPEEQAAKGAITYIAMTACAIHYGAGNCGEHARTALHLHTKTTDASDVIRVVKTDGINHAWVEISARPGQKSDDDVLLDSYTNSPAILRKHSRFGMGETTTMVEYSSIASRQWLAQQVDAVVGKLEDNPKPLEGLTANTAKLARRKYVFKKLQGAVQSVPLALSDQFLIAAKMAASGVGMEITSSCERNGAVAAGVAGLPTQSSASKEAFAASVHARDNLLASAPPADQGWEDQLLTHGERGNSR